MRQLVSDRYAKVTWGLLVGGTAWGLVSFGFLLWLPLNLTELGVDAKATSALLARSAIYALPGIGIVIWLYHSWSSFRALVLFLALTAACLLAFAALKVFGVTAEAVTTVATVSLLVSVSGVIAMLSPYAAEIYPVHLRGTGSGMVAASSKFGGIIGAGLGVVGFFEHFALSAVLIALPLGVSAAMLWRSGVETRGYRLEEIQETMRAK
jgi:putative MFS transporter